MLINVRIAVAVALASMVAAPTAIASRDTTTAVRCTEIRVPVALAPGQSDDQEIAGELCLPHAPSHGQQSAPILQVLLHGSLADRSEFDFANPGSGSPFQYSYQHWALEAGYATLALDRLGAGRSTIPPESKSLTLAADAYTIHQVILRARSGQFGPRFGRVVVYGHSFGAETATAVAAFYPRDVNALVLTGLVHHAGEAVTSGDLLDSARPAKEDPKFSTLPLDAGWTTVRMGYDELSFYGPTTDAKVAAKAYEDRGMFSFAEAEDFLTDISKPAEQTISASVRVPVLTAIGDQDEYYCGSGLDCTKAGAVADFERPYLRNAASVTVYTVPQTGHTVLLHETALSLWTPVALRWIRQTVGC